MQLSLNDIEIIFFQDTQIIYRDWVCKKSSSQYS